MCHTVMLPSISVVVLGLENDVLEHKFLDLRVEVQQWCTVANYLLVLQVTSEQHKLCHNLAVKAPCDCHLDSFEPLALFNKVFIA